MSDSTYIDVRKESPGTSGALPTCGRAITRVCEEREDAPEYGRVPVVAQDVARYRRCPPGRAGRPYSAALGSHRVTVVPAPSALSITILPFDWRTKP